MAGFDYGAYFGPILPLADALRDNDTRCWGDGAEPDKARHDYVLYLGCNVLRTVALAEIIVAILTELGVDFVALGGRVEHGVEELVDLAGFENLMPSELSGGMIKRAALARAIIMDPKILFCDEPSAGLDPVVSNAIDDLLLKLRDTMGMSIVVVTHELDSAFKIADRITVLDKGEILLIGTVDELKRSDNQRIQNMLNRQSSEEDLDPEAYLRRLTGEGIMVEAA